MQMDGDPVEVVHPERADVAGRVRRPWRVRPRRFRVEHRVIDDELTAPPEEVAQCLRPVLALEDVLLFHELPRQVAPLPAQLVAHPRELLLLCQVPLPRLEPFVVLHHLVTWHVILLLTDDFSCIHLSHSAKAGGVTRWSRIALLPLAYAIRRRRPGFPTRPKKKQPPPKHAQPASR